ncbi:hypothetical protein COEREDRAFT_79742 [Coemansia reversa NRRL 1564]|uniref:Uncharacterized protein n=1 Tax=Coemansia reversa (strain ATCC 12441 / NRRL 1564) TaxID=763665 RepID=A0A2G5BIB1_COERN|nr:hypothetical protein COEREDRAFT_79742 [Coemansia reversa NRRL 1564]|eukprot:PIA18756.1 hypothetical protein COEREDRAFT_79742 [Coemansia reversa NRRL 1564]
MAAAPLWQASVKPGAAVVDMDFSYCVDENNVPESQPLRRSSSVSEARMPSHHITDHSNERESSCDSAAASLQPERRRIGGLSVASEAVRRHEERHTKPVSSSLFVDGKGKTNFRPPQHPSISKFRAAVTEHQLKAATGKLSKTAALRSPASPEHCREQREPGYESIVNSEGFAPLALNSENISLLAKDRSYMDLLSPAKTGKFTGITGDTLLTPALNDNMLSILSGVKPQSDEEENVGLSHNNSLEYIQDGCVRDAATKEAQTACAKDTAINSARAMPRDMSLCFPERNVAAATNLQFNDPSPMSLPQHTQPKPKPSQDHSQKLDTGDSIMEMFTPERLPRCTTAPVHTLAKNESEYDHLTSGKSTDSIPRMLVSQLLNNKHPARPDERSPADTRTIAAVSDIGHHPATSAPSEPFEQHISAAAPINSKQAPIETSLRSISSSVLQNAISDALAPVCDQIRGEIRNLHLDILRQGFVYQEQVKALRQECGEARALRQEIENLRQENEQLRRYVPFFGEGQGDVNNPSSI